MYKWRASRCNESTCSPLKKGKSNMTQTVSFRLYHILKGSSRMLLIIPLLMVMLGFVVFSAAPAAHAASLSATRQCAVVLARLQPGEQTSRVLFSQCVQGNQPLVVPLTSTLLTTVYLGDNFTGSHTSIFGNAGPCDSTGYHIDRMPSGFNNDISSYKVFNNCAFTRDYAGNDESGDCAGTFVGDVFSLAGTGMDNRMNSMRLSSVFHSC